MLSYQIFSSPIGEILVAGTQYAVTHIYRGDSRSELSARFLMEHDTASAAGRNDCILEACAAISDYLQGKSQSIDVAVETGGTEFQRRVWRELCEIPFGATSSYSDVAQRIGAPDAFRAVASACGDNPVPLIVPCHRVIHKNGDVSGFAWGKDVKRFLLNLEKEHADSAVAA